MKKLTKYILIGVVSLLAVSGATFGILQVLDITNEPTGGDTPPVTVESYLSTPKNIELSLNLKLSTTTWKEETEYILSWDYVAHAEKFCITVGEKEFYTTEQTQQSYDISSAVTAGETYDIKVKAIGDGVKYGDSKNGLITETIKKVTDNLVYTELEDGTYSVKKKNIDVVINGPLVLPDRYEGKEITVIALCGFEETYDDNRPVLTQKGITSVRLPKYLKKINALAFSSCVKLQKVVLPESVTEYGNDIFYYCKSLTSITFPENMTVIPSSICRGCSSLKSVKLPSGLIEIDNYAFDKTGLESIEIPETVRIIGDEAFSNTKIKSVEFPSGLKELRGFSFTEIEEVKIPASVEYIKGSFNCCEKLEKVVFEKNSLLTSIDYKTFNRTPLKEIILPDGIETIGDYAFQDTLLTEIDLPEGLISIGDYAFANTFLEEIEIPASVTSIGVGICAPYSAVTNKTNESTLKEIKVAQGNTTYKAIDGNLYTADGKTLLQYAIGKTETEFVTPDGLEAITERAFFGAIYLQKIRLRYGVRLVGGNAFENCVALKSLEIPDDIFLDNRFIKGCDSLVLVQIPPNAIAYIKTTPAKYIEYLDGRIEIADQSIGNNNGKPNIIIPKSVKRIVGISAADFGMPLNYPVSFYYKGTAEEWLLIELVALGTDDITMYYYSETEPPLNSDGTGYDGNYWYYDENGVPVVWEYNSTEE